MRRDIIFVVDKYLKTCKGLFDKSPIAFGIARVYLDEEGNPLDFSYEYLNPSMAQITDQTIDDLLGKKVYEMWGGDTTWLRNFYRAAYKGEAIDFEAVSVIIEQFIHTTVFPTSTEGYCAFIIQNVMSWIPQMNVATGDSAADLFFYDTALKMVMMPPAACKTYGLKTPYGSLNALLKKIFIPSVAEDAMARIAIFDSEGGSLSIEGEGENDHWLRLTIMHPGKPLQFGLGQIEDVTRTHDAELATQHTMQELRRQKTALEDALILAERASDAKSTFLTNMSHDFRTPMNSITGFTELALNSLDDIDKVRDCLEKISLSSRHLLNLVNDILDMSRIESGKMALNEEPLDLKRLVDNLEQMFSEQAEKRNMDFSIGMGAVRDSFVMADGLRLSQILVNIIGNAFKFTDDGGRVEVRIAQRDGSTPEYGRYAFQIADNGCGMEAGFEERLFKPFNRGDSSNVAHKEGTGLGMAITKNIIDLMGGIIHVASKPGDGSIFVVTIPLRIINSAPADSRRDGDAADVKSARFDGKRVLVVDDDELSRELMSEVMRRRGFEIEDADDGDVALDMFTKSPEGHFDVVLMDLRMKRMDGDDAAKAMRKSGRKDSELPIIAVTADAFEESAKRAISAGMTAHTTKPLNLGKLIEILRDVLS